MKKSKFLIFVFILTLSLIVYGLGEVIISKGGISNKAINGTILTVNNSYAGDMGWNVTTARPHLHNYSQLSTTNTSNYWNYNWSLDILCADGGGGSIMSNAAVGGVDKGNFKWGAWVRLNDNIGENWIALKNSDDNSRLVIGVGTANYPNCYGGGALDAFVLANKGGTIICSNQAVTFNENKWIYFLHNVTNGNDSVYSGYDPLNLTFDQSFVWNETPAFITQYCGGGYYLNGRYADIVLYNGTLTPYDIVNIIPVWKDNRTNYPSIYSNTTLSYFNITWTDDSSVSSAKFESNYSGSRVNYTMNAIVGNYTFNYSNILRAGSHYWKSYATDNVGETNISDTWYININQAKSSVGLALNGTSSSKTIKNNTILSLSCNLIKGETNLFLYRNGTILNSTRYSLNYSNNFSAVGYYNITCLHPATNNYTENLTSYFVTVTSSYAPIWSNNRTNSPSIYSNTTLSYFNITWTDDDSINYVRFEHNISNVKTNYTMNAIVGNYTYNYSKVLVAGTHYWKSYSADNAGNINISDTWKVTISKAQSSVNLTLNSSSASITIRNNTLLNLSCNLLKGETNLLLKVNGSTINSSGYYVGNRYNFSKVGYYYIDCVHSATTNYTINTSTYYVTVSNDYYPAWKDNRTKYPSIYSNTTLSYFNITWTDDSSVSSAKFESNYSGSRVNYTMNAIVGNYTFNYSNILKAGSHYWKSYGTDDVNQINTSSTWYINISKAESSINLSINGSNANLTAINNTIINLNCSLIKGETNIYLYNNNSLVNSGKYSLNNATNFSRAGFYNVTCIYLTTNNYTENRTSYWVNITNSENVIITRNSPQNGVYATTNLTANVTLTDTLGINFANSSLVIGNVINQTSYNISSGNTVIFNASQMYNGTFNWSIQACVNNSVCYLSSNYTYIIDTQRPIINLYNPPANGNVSPLNLSLNIEVYSINLNYSNLTISYPNNTIFYTQWLNTSPTNYTYNHLINFTAEFNYTIYVEARSLSGNINNRTTYYYFDMSAPNITITNPTGTETTKTGIPLQTTISDKSPTSCYYNITRNNAVYTSEVPNTGFDCGSTTFSVSADANYLVFVMATDGVYNSTYNQSFTVDTSVPAPPSSGGGGGGIPLTLTAPKKKCNIEISPSTIYLNTNQRLQEIKITNLENESYDPEFKFSFNSGLDYTDYLSITNDPKAIFKGIPTSFGVRYIGNQEQGGVALLSLTNPKCSDIEIKIVINSGTPAILENIFDPEKTLTQNIIDLTLAPISEKEPLNIIKVWYILVVYSLITAIFLFNRIKKNNLSGSKIEIVLLILFGLVVTLVLTLLTYIGLKNLFGWLGW